MDRLKKNKTEKKTKEKKKLKNFIIKIKKTNIKKIKKIFTKYKIIKKLIILSVIKNNQFIVNNFLNWLKILNYIEKDNFFNYIDNYLFQLFLKKLTKNNKNSFILKNKITNEENKKILEKLIKKDKSKIKNYFYNYNEIKEKKIEEKKKILINELKKKNSIEEKLYIINIIDNIIKKKNKIEEKLYLILFYKIGKKLKKKNNLKTKLITGKIIFDKLIKSTKKIIKKNKKKIFGIKIKEKYKKNIIAIMHSFPCFYRKKKFKKIKNIKRIKYCLKITKKIIDLS